MMSKRLLVFMLALLPIIAHATHLRAGHIRVVSTSGLKCLIEMRLFTDLSSPIKAGEGYFNFGDESLILTPTMDHVVLPNQPGVGLVVYTFEHTYTFPGSYILSYTEPNLNAQILNVPNSVETPFYIESSVSVLWNESYSSPEFLTEPILVCPSRRTYSFSAAAIDDSAKNEFFYKYSLIAPKRAKNISIAGYTVPGNLSVNPNNGIATWDTKYNGQYVAGLVWMVIRVGKYSSTGAYLGYVDRATQIIVEDNDSKVAMTSSVTDPDNDLLVVEGEEKKIKIILSDNIDVDDLHFEIFRNSVIKDNVSIVQYDSLAIGQKVKVAILTLKTTEKAVSSLPYPITLRGYASYQTDITFLYRTKVTPPLVVVGITNEEPLRIYPNPFHAEIFVDGTGPGHATFINTFGEVVMRTEVQQGERINTAQLPSGLYLLQITDKNGVRNWVKVLRY